MSRDLVIWPTCFFPFNKKILLNGQNTNFVELCGRSSLNSLIELVNRGGNYQGDLACKLHLTISFDLKFHFFYFVPTFANLSDGCHKNT